MTGVLKMNTIASEQRILNNKLRRKRQLRRRKKAGALILLTAIFFFSAFFSLRIRARVPMTVRRSPNTIPVFR